MGIKIDRGETSVQVVLAFPAILLMLLFAIQATMILHAGNVGTAAASQGVVAVAALDGGDSHGIARVREIATDLGAHLANAPSIRKEGEEVVVTVRVRIPKLLPWMSDVVTRTARAPIERFIPEYER